METQESDSPIKYWKYIALVIFNVIFLFVLIFILVKQWISVSLFIIILVLNVLFYVIVGLVVYLKNRFFGNPEELQLKETNIIERKQARELTDLMMKRDYWTNIEITGDDYQEQIIHLGQEGKPKTPIYLLKARDKYSTKKFLIAMRLDNPTKTVVQRNGDYNEFMEAVRMLAEQSAKEDEVVRNYFDDEGHITKTEREVRRVPQNITTQIQEEKKVEVG